MIELSPIPEAWVEERMPNLDMVSYFPPELSESDVSWTALNNLALLIGKAQVAAVNAVSWRDYIVGSTAMAVDLETSLMAYLSGFNVKPAEDGAINIHAEQFAIEKVRREGFKHIAAIAIWGEPESDPSLRPCDLCIDFMSEAHEVSDNTVIISGNSDFSVCEIYGLDDLILMREDKTVPPIQRITLADNALERIEYDEALMFLLLDVWTRLNPQARYSAEFRQWLDEAQPLVKG